MKRSFSGGISHLLVRRWLRDRTSRATALLLGTAFAGFAVVIIAVSAFTPTAAQEADAALGTSQQRSYFSVEVGDLTFDIENLNEDSDSAYLFLESTQLRPDALTKTFVQSPIASVRFVQGARLQDLFPGRYRVDDGEWPTRPGDVLVSAALAEKLSGASDFSVLSGRVDLRVSGTVTDNFNKHGDLIVAAPGTWERIPSLPPAKTYQPVGAEVVALVNQTMTMSQVHARLSRELPKAARKQLSSLSTNVTTRGQLLSEPVTPFASDRLLLSYGPLYLVMILMAALAAGRARPARRFARAQLYATGVRGGVLRAQLISEVLVGAASAVAGLGVGWLAGVALHLWVLPIFANQTLSPVAGVGVHAGVLIAVVIVVLLIGVAWPGSDGDTAAGVDSASTKGQARVLRWVTAFLLMIGAVGVGTSVASKTSAYLAVAACALLSPDLLRLVVGALPRRWPRALTAQALMRATELRQATGVVAIACCVALPVLTATQLASTKDTNASFAFGRVPANQVWIQNDSTGSGDVAAVSQAVSTVNGLEPPVAIRGSEYSRNPDDPRSAKTYLTQTSKKAGFTSSALMIVESASDAERVIGRYLDADGVDTLERGGVLVFTGAEGQQRLRVEAATGDVLLLTPPLPTLGLDVSRQLRSQFGGALLLDTATALGIPVNPPRRFVFTDVDADEIAAAAQAAVDAGYDSEFVQYAVPPPEPVLPIYAYSFAFALLFTGFVLLLVVLRDSAHRLRERCSMLLALGLTPTWITSVALLQVVLLAAVGFAVGVGAGLLGIAVTASAYAVTAVPTVAVVLASVGTGIIVVTATAIALRGITADEQIV